MSTKPTETPRWAETAGGTPASNITTPSSGQLDTGWTANQVGVSGYDNWRQRLVYKWIQWLNDGDCAFDDLTYVTDHHGDRTLAIAAHDASFNTGDWTYGTGSITAASSNSALLSPKLRIGDRIKSLSFLCFGDGVTDLSVGITGLCANGTSATIASTTFTNMAASWTTLTWDFTDHTLGQSFNSSTSAALYLFFQRTGGTGGIQIGAISLTYDRP